MAGLGGIKDAVSESKFDGGVAKRKQPTLEVQAQLPHQRSEIQNFQPSKVSFTRPVFQNALISFFTCTNSFICHTGKKNSNDQIPYLPNQLSSQRNT
jgi:hypothetical protein